MRKWTWQWLVLLGLLGALFSCGAWIDRQPYHIYEDVYKPNNPWQQMIWEAKGEIADFRLMRGARHKAHGARESVEVTHTAYCLVATEESG